MITLRKTEESYFLTKTNIGAKYEKSKYMIFPAILILKSMINKNNLIRGLDMSFCKNERAIISIHDSYLR